MSSKEANMLDCEAEARWVAAQKAEAGRLAALRQASAIPAEAGEAIAPAPARTSFVLLDPSRLRDVEPEYARTAKGYARVRPIRAADVFDLMGAQARRRKVGHPLVPSQIEVARRYRGLVEVLSADGCKLSSLERSYAGGEAGHWMDRRLMISAEVEGLQRRIGNGVAMAVRRVRPSQRGAAQRGPILDRVLVDMVCLKDCTVDDVLRSHGWQVNGRHRECVLHALSGALWRMVGYRDEKGP